MARHAGSGAPARSLVVLLAHPAGHSLSPAMHLAAFRARGLRADYRALDVPPDRLASAVEALRAAPYLGANVSVPHKEAVMGLLDELTDEARAVGAVNTIARRGRRLVGENTDGEGFMRALAELGPDPATERAAYGADPTGERAADLAGVTCLVLGAGGAARAVVHALSAAGADVHVLNRDAERARRLVQELGGRARAVGAAPRGLLEGASLLVNCTTVGMEGGPDPHGLPLLSEDDLDALPKEARVVDLVYRPAITPLLAAADGRGLTTQNGVPMLVWQGALAFEAWTGLGAPVAEMRAAVERGLGPTPRHGRRALDS